ncbi:GGDEF domain-containing protein [Rheinheimera salexigens]|uniref:GGDEF domain-containing protein n=1 Tax=Rheinheimera salexigens TaxID=1628148 RepID=UPI000B1AE2FF|nr:GGDEF domain-containing protein [Rheinheimera salexigens]
MHNDRQQLDKAIKARKLLEDTYEAQFKILAQFVSRLSLACKGVDVELDNRLAKLRSELNRGTDLEKLIPFIESTSTCLQQLESKHQLELQKAQQGIATAGKYLQLQKGLPDQLRRDLRSLLVSVEQPSATVHAFLPHLTKLSELYQSALQTKASIDQNQTSDTRYTEICRKISNELTNLLSELAFAEESAIEIDGIRSSLLGELSIEALLQACLKTINIIIQSINNERQLSEHFLLKLNDTLATVQQAVIASVSSSSALQSQLISFNQQISLQISNLSKSSRSATSLEQLKLLVADKLTTISLSLEQQQQLELDHRQNMLQTLTGMTQRLHELEQDAVIFKQRIAEQNFRSLQDSLTQIPNRAAFDERYQFELKRAKRYNSPLCVVIADVDHFKSINDNYGHNAGDKTLKVIAKALKNTLRETDFIARYGGEEFIFLFPKTALKDLEKPLNTLRDKIANIPFKFKNVKVPITISFGATQLISTDTQRSAVDRADKALYEAKHTGRNQVVLKLASENVTD